MTSIGGPGGIGGPKGPGGPTGPDGPDGPDDIDAPGEVGQVDEARAARAAGEREAMAADIAAGKLTAKEAVDGAGPAVFGLVPGELINLRGRGDAAGGVQGQAAEEGVVVGERGRGDGGQAQFCVDGAVDLFRSLTHRLTPHWREGRGEG